MKVSEWKKLTGLDSIKFCKEYNVNYSTFKVSLKRGYSFIFPKTDRKHPLRQAYQSIQKRCYNKNSQDYYLYGARGIRMSGEFFYSFKAFAEYMGEKPGPEYSIDRIDNNGNYERGNIRWADCCQQCVNQRMRENSTNHKNITKVKSGKYRVKITRYGKEFGSGNFISLDNAIATREILKYRIDNGTYT